MQSNRTRSSDGYFQHDKTPCHKQEPSETWFKKHTQTEKYLTDTSGNSLSSAFFPVTNAGSYRSCMRCGRTEDSQHETMKKEAHGKSTGIAG